MNPTPNNEEQNMTTLASVASTLPRSELDEAFVTVERLRHSFTKEIIELHVGEPFFRPPETVAHALSEAVLHRSMSYTPVEGLPELRAALAAKVAAVRGGTVDASHVFITPGSCQGLAALMQALSSPGGEVLMPDLYWPNHLQQVLLAGLRPRFYRVHDGKVSVDRILELANDKTNLVLVNSPANPSGMIWPEPVVRDLVEAARSGGWQIVSDEAYEDFVYDGRHFSPAACEIDQPAEDRVVTTVHTFSKAYAMTGYRVGYVVTATSAVARALRVVQEANLIAMSTPVQYAAAQALTEKCFVANNRQTLLEARDKVLPALVDAELMPTLPAGGWYAVLDVSSTGLSATDFVQGLLEETGVALVRGTGFAQIPETDEHGRIIKMTSSPWAQSLVRMAFCVDPEVLARGVEKIVAYAARGSLLKCSI